MSKEITNTQKKSIIELAKQDLPVKEIIERVYSLRLDARSKLGRDIIKIIEDEGLTPNTKKQRIYQEEDHIELTDEQKEYVRDNLSSQSHIQIARILFGPDVKQLSLEQRAVSRYAATLPDSIQESEEVRERKINYELDEYKSPINEHAAFALVKKYVNPLLSTSKLTPHQQKGVELLIVNMGSVKFKQQIASYTNANDRELFESEFVRLTWEKTDLNAEDVGQYIDLCYDIVYRKNLQREVEKITEEMALLDRLPLAIVQAKKTISDSLDQCSKRIKSLNETLNSKRNERLKNKKESNICITNFIEAWKEKKKRDELIQFAIQRQNANAKEIENQRTLDETISLIHGITEEEVLYG